MITIKTYIGAKIIKAEPMDRCSFLKSEKKQDTTGMETEPGYKVVYPDNYISWSPKAVFETAYRVITDDEKTLM
ncbi:MAG: hypothetical protein GY749_02230 [Desulfobacteraceae bacterium]|nr:hypothetical protein [Desulfobacteraceae bacterium]